MRGSGIESSRERGGARRPARAPAGLAWGRLLWALLALALAFLVVSKGRVLRVTSEDMAPTLLPGDQVYVLEDAWSGRAPRRGELAALALVGAGARLEPRDRAPGLPEVVEILRIIGVPGDRVEITGDRLRISGEWARDELLHATYTAADGKTLRLYLESLQADSESRWNSYTVTRDRDNAEEELSATPVEPGRYLALGDNRSRAYDGRFWGSVARADLVGRPLVVIFSRDPHTGAIRWRRIGTLLGS